MNAAATHHEPSQLQRTHGVPGGAVWGARVSTEEVEANPLLREAARVLADIYLSDDGYLGKWLDGEDHQPIARREWVADLIDADHVIEWRIRWAELLGGAPRRMDDEDEPWLIDRPWQAMAALAEASGVEDGRP